MKKIFFTHFIDPRFLGDLCAPIYKMKTVDGDCGCMAGGIPGPQVFVTKSRAPWEYKDYRGCKGYRV